jgi:hypothetical protein
VLRFFIAIILLTVTLFVALYTAQAQEWIATFPSFTLEILFFLASSTLIIFYILIKRDDPESFTQSYLLSIAVKILFYGAFIFVLIFMDSPGASLNTAFFIASYVLYTALEVTFLFKRKNG